MDVSSRRDAYQCTVGNVSTTELGGSNILERLSGAKEFWNNCSIGSHIIFISGVIFLVYFVISVHFVTLLQGFGVISLLFEFNN